MPLPLSTLAAEARRPVVPMPEFLLKAMLGRAGLPNLPVGALNHIKFPVVVDGAAFAKLGYQHKHDELQTVRAFAQAYPPR
jgi:UDP-glucose 4-epimerase